MKFYDRVNEMQILQENEAQAERNAVFTVLMGRRRVGKTSLITHAMEGREYAYLFISRDKDTDAYLDNSQFTFGLNDSSVHVRFYF